VRNAVSLSTAFSSQPSLDEGSLHSQLSFVENTLDLKDANHFRRDIAYDCNSNADDKLDKHWTTRDIVKGRNYVHGMYLSLFMDYLSTLSVN
jgi:hypothetical protein